MLSPIEKPAGEKQKADGNKGLRGGRRARNPVENVRYFVGRPGDGDSKPMLEQEVATEPEALVIGFKSDCRIYFISEYRVTQRIEGSQVRLEKEPAAVVQRVSNLNES
ncbi:MAG TPA: hypothetical protein VIY49_11725 [Bryobacteraceae bacterium]